MYHHVSPDRSEGLTISTEKLEAQFAHLAEAGFRSYHLGELMDFAKLPGEKNVVITFDDAYVSQLEYAYPLLKRYGLKATFFVPLAYLGKTDTWNTALLPIMTAEQLKSLDTNVVELGFHSYKHGRYDNMTREEVAEDTRRCFETVDQNDLSLSATLAYPYGKFPRKGTEKETFFNDLKEQGFRYGLRIGNRVNRFPFKSSYEVQRIDVKGEYALSKFRRKLKYGKWADFFG